MNENLEGRTEEGKLIPVVHVGRDLEVLAPYDSIKRKDILLFSNGQQSWVDHSEKSLLLLLERSPIKEGVIVSRTYVHYKSSSPPNNFPVFYPIEIKEYSLRPEDQGLFDCWLEEAGM